MNLQEMVHEVRNIVQDPYWTDQLIINYINQGLKIVATGVLLSRVELTPPLPELFNIDTVTTGDSGGGVVSMPSDFDRNLNMVVNESGESLSLDPSFKRFALRYPKVGEGSVHTCSQHGKRLFYRDEPASPETLTLHYYRVPDLLVDEDDEPDCLPEILHKPVLIGHACVQIFNQIEDGMEGKKANAEFWMNEFRQGLFNNLSLIAGDEKLPQFYSDVTPRIGRDGDR